VFQSLPGVAQTASLTYSKDQVIWMPASASRATEPCANAANGVGCLGATRNLTTSATGSIAGGVQLLLNNEYYGERVTTFDLKFAKNIRFAQKRLQIGIDIYNFFNSDAITAYNGTYTVEDPNTTAIENHWLEPTGLVSPRFFRFQVQFNF